MLRQVEYHPEAKLEIRNSAIWYDDKADGLGLEFLLELRNAESLIRKNPELWPNYEAGTRRCVMQRFPFAVIYLVSGEIHSPLGSETNPFFSVWSAIKQGWPGILMQLVLIPVIFWAAGKFTLRKQAG